MTQGQPERYLRAPTATTSAILSCCHQLLLDNPFFFFLTMVQCAECLNPTRDLLRSNHRRNPFGSACAVFPRIHRFATGPTRRPGMKKTARPTSTTTKAIGKRLTNLSLKK
jgi:hypothetical protein